MRNEKIKAALSLNRSVQFAMQEMLLDWYVLIEDFEAMEVTVEKMKEEAMRKNLTKEGFMLDEMMSFYEALHFGWQSTAGTIETAPYIFDRQQDDWERIIENTFLFLDAIGFLRKDTEFKENVLAALETNSTTKMAALLGLGRYSFGDKEFQVQRTLRSLINEPDL